MSPQKMGHWGHSTNLDVPSKNAYKSDVFRRLWDIGKNECPITEKPLFKRVFLLKNGKMGHSFLFLYLLLFGTFHVRVFVPILTAFLILSKMVCNTPSKTGYFQGFYVLRPFLTAMSLISLVLST